MLDVDVTRIRQLLREFVGDDPGRSIALRGLHGVKIEGDVQGDVPRPGASVLKVPLVIAVFEAANDGVLDLDIPVTRAQLPSSCYPSVMQVFTSDHSFTMRELCGLALATSDNPIAQFLLDRIGCDRVNAVLTQHGCRASTLRVGFGDDDFGASRQANVTTASDVVRFFAGVYADPRYEYVLHALANGVRNTRIPLRLPDELRIAHKTGSLEGVASDAGVLYGRHTHLALAVLTDGQADTAATSIAIGDCIGDVWAALGEEAS